MTVITVDDKLLYINEFRDFLELVRDKIGIDAEKYLDNNLFKRNELIEGIRSLVDNLDDTEFGDGYNLALNDVIDYILCE